MQFTWIDALMGAALTVGLIYAFYRIDARYVWKCEKLGFVAHLTKTGLFPRRATGYISALGLLLAFLNGIRANMSPGLTNDIVDLFFRIMFYPFLALIAICLVLVLKVIIFPSKDDPDRFIFNKNRDLGK